MDDNETPHVNAAPGPKGAPDKRDPHGETPQDEKALVEKWCNRIRAAKRYWQPVFDRMKDCQQLAAYGADKKWIEAERFTVPLLSRFVNIAVSQLYAKNPQTEAKPRKQMRYQVWDGRQDTLKAAQEGALMGDPQSMAIINDVQQANDYSAMLDRLGKTVSIVYDYYCGELSSGYKMQFKALVRRTKVNGVGYVKLGFQRTTQMNPEVAAKIDDMRDQLAKLDRLLKENEEGDVKADSPEAAELKNQIMTLQKEPEVVLREGLVFDFPRSTQIIPDMDCVHLKSFAGCSWIVHEMELTESRVQEIYGIDVAGNYDPVRMSSLSTTADLAGAPDKARVWEVQHKRGGEVFTIIEGYPAFVRPPGPPDVKIDRFWTIFPLIFNEVEHDQDIYPPPDVWQARHIQFEYNRSRDGLREHRIAARPQYIAPKGRLSDPDKEKLSSGIAFALLELDAIGPNDDIKKYLQRKPVENIDPNMYETGSLYDDLLRTVGVSRAELGQPGGDVTATASTISANAQTAENSENVDDLDTLLSELARYGAQILLQNLTKETAVEIAGPGAVWPETVLTAEEVAKDLVLDIKAGSSGKPNKPQELANYERAMPTLLQIPGINPIEGIAKPYLDLLDIDLEKALAEGMPSVVAQNALMAKMALGGPPQPGGPETGASGAGSPNANGGPEGQLPNAVNGAAGVQASGEGTAGPQPGFPAGPPALQ